MYSGTAQHLHCCEWSRESLNLRSTEMMQPADTGQDLFNKLYNCMNGRGGKHSIPNGLLYLWTWKQSKRCVNALEANKHCMYVDGALMPTSLCWQLSMAETLNFCSSAPCDFRDNTSHSKRTTGQKLPHGSSMRPIIYQWGGLASYWERAGHARLLLGDNMWQHVS